MFGFNKKQAAPVQSADTGSAFVRHADHQASVAEAKARIAALDTLHAAAHTTLDDLEAEAVRVHASQDVLFVRAQSILGRL